MNPRLEISIPSAHAGTVGRNRTEMRKKEIRKKTAVALISSAKLHMSSTCLNLFIHPKEKQHRGITVLSTYHEVLGGDWKSDSCFYASEKRLVKFQTPSRCDSNAGL